MGIFNKLNTAEPVTRAAVAAAGQYRASENLIGNFISYQQSADRLRAIKVPTISRSRDLICSMVACLTMSQYTQQWNGDELEEIAIPPDVWFNRPDPNSTRNFILSWTTDDLLFFGRAFWIITERFGNGFPKAFQWMPAANVQTLDMAGPIWWGPSKQITWQGMPVDPRDVVQFISPIQSLLSMGDSAILTALRLNRSAERFAVNEIPSGWLKQTGGEPMDPTALADLAAGWAEARQSNSIAALNEYVDWHESSIDPSKLQLTEARTFQSLELARVANIPSYLVGAPTGGGMTYANAQQARQDLYLFGAKPFIDCIEQTLSMDNVLPRGRFLKLDVTAYLEENVMGTEAARPVAPTASEPASMTIKD